MCTGHALKGSLCQFLLLPLLFVAEEESSSTWLAALSHKIKI
jgi:hypothetical protein